jgi:thiosulfate/3-mercaptopyruvate sulfurtransferase
MDATLATPAGTSSLPGARQLLARLGARAGLAALAGHAALALALALVAQPAAAQVPPPPREAAPPLDARGYARPEMLISTDELARRLGTPGLRIVDATDPAAYARAHLPGAVNLHYLALSRIDERRASGQPTSSFEAERLFGGAGIGADTEVVVYDGGEGAPASGVWFALRFFGHDRVRVLDGGFARWLREGRPVTQALPAIERVKFSPEPRRELIVDRRWLQQHLGDEGVVVADTRSRDEYLGRELPPGASRGGRIPGAIHLEWTNFAADGASFATAAQIESALARRGIGRDTRVVAYCQSGLGRSTHVAFAMRLIGWDQVVGYPGSWEEWSADPRLPLQR